MKFVINVIEKKEIDFILQKQKLLIESKYIDDKNLKSDELVRYINALKQENKKINNYNVLVIKKNTNKIMIKLFLGV